MAKGEVRMVGAKAEAKARMDGAKTIMTTGAKKKSTKTGLA